MKNHKEGRSWIRNLPLQLSPPSLKDNTADVDRLIRGIKKGLEAEAVRIDFSLIKKATQTLRKYDYNVRAAVFQERNGWCLIDIFGAREGGGIYGLAFDLGSSTLVLRLMNLEDGEVQDEVSFHNPQIEIGADILTRIHFAAHEGGLSRLQDILIDRLNEEIGRLAEKNSINPKSIVGMSVAGNTTMTHLFLGLDPYWICREPYIPVVNSPGLITSYELGLTINPGAPVLVSPNVGSYFGGDLIVGILASGMTHQSEVSFLVDVGTNAEVVIGNRDWLMACAGAAGPALEGGVADMGMMAGPGVIDKVTIDPVTREFKIRTIQDQSAADALQGKRPVGICGSGLIDLVAQLYLTGMIDLRGKFVEGACGDRLVEMDGVRHLIVVPSENSGTGRDLTLSQTDIDGLIRSKAAMYTILTTIANTVNIPLKEIGRFYVAGTFGSYIDPQSAITIGMIPDLPIETYISLGNTSLEGASMALLSAGAKQALFQIRDRITYLELNVNQGFMNLFSAAKFIPHTDRSLFPSVKTRN
ncbi:MAG: ASKHA domain-containing protein [Pseudomonadota bacterium]